MKFKTFCASGHSKELLLDTLKFITKHISLTTNHTNLIDGFYKDKNGILVFCKKQKNDKDSIITYPFQPTETVLVEHIYQYLNELSTDELTALNAMPDDYDEESTLGWELFIPDWYSDEHGISNYTFGKTLLAVKPKIIESGK